MSLLFSTVSSVNLVSASSSVFVLVLSALFMFSPTDRITSMKVLLVLCNLFGKLISKYAKANLLRDILYLERIGHS